MLDLTFRQSLLPLTLQPSKAKLLRRISYFTHAGLIAVVSVRGG